MAQQNQGVKPEFTAVEEKATPVSKRLNDGIDLSRFNYNGEFIGQQYEKYCALVNGTFDEDDAGRPIQTAPGLPMTAKYDFVGYKVVIIKKRLFPQSKIDTTTIVAGFRIMEEKPFRETQNTLSSIKILNDQLENNNGKVPMIYYLLKKY